jgi:hypothetical protein
MCKYEIVDVALANFESISVVCRLMKHGSDVVRPVALYMICDPISTANDPPAYHQPLWNMLLSLKNQDLTNACLPWLQVRSFIFMIQFPT